MRVIAKSIKKFPQIWRNFKKLFNKFNDLSEYIRISDGKIWKNLTIKSYTLCVHRVNERRVVHTVKTSCVIETNCPKLTKLSLLEFARDIRILSCFHNSSFCTRIDITIHTAKTLCKSKDIFMSFVCHHTTFYTSHKREIRYWELYLEGIIFRMGERDELRAG